MRFNTRAIIRNIADFASNDRLSERSQQHAKKVNFIIYS